MLILLTIDKHNGKLPFGELKQISMISSEELGF